MTERRAYLLMVISIPILWYGAIWLFDPKPVLFPPLDLVGRVLFEERMELLHHTWTTLKEAVIGYAFANVLAIGLAVSFLYVRWFESFATPWMVVVKNIPFPTIASILIVTMGDTLGPKVIIVILITFFPILANVSKGLKSVDTVLLDRMKSLNASNWEIFTKACWPAALPYYIAAHEIAFTGSIIGAIVAEWLFAQKGLGYLIVQSTTEFRTDRLYAVTVIASLLAIFAYFLVRVLEKVLFKWREDEAG